MTITIDGVDPTRVPKHIACVMDGNGRWAQQRGLKRTEGHSAGEKAMLETVYAALDVGVEWLTVYAFSTENWKRPVSEVRYLMQLNENILVRNIDELHEKGIRVLFLGRRDWRVPGRLLREMERAAAMTKDNTKMTLTIAFNYGGRAEIVDAMKRMIDSGVSSKDIDEKSVQKYLYNPEMPDPDLVVRTSGEYRISNFLLWELAYSELVFTDVLWPDFGKKQLYIAIEEYQNRTRRFGKIASLKERILSASKASSSTGANAPATAGAAR